jgi:flagellum-specific peptidoglycan hydrolase FlgJ
VTVTAAFRSYNSYAESFQDHANVIRSTAFGDTYHYSGVWKSNTSSYRDATAALAGSYANHIELNYMLQLTNSIFRHSLDQLHNFQLKRLLHRDNC